MEKTKRPVFNKNKTFHAMILKNKKAKMNEKENSKVLRDTSKATVDTLQACKIDLQDFQGMMHNKSMTKESSVPKLFTKEDISNTEDYELDDTRVQEHSQEPSEAPKYINFPLSLSPPDRNEGTSDIPSVVRETLRHSIDQGQFGLRRADPDSHPGVLNKPAALDALPRPDNKPSLVLNDYRLI